MMRWTIFLAFLLTGCATHAYKPPPKFGGEPIIEIKGRRLCGLHKTPLKKAKVYTYDPEVVFEALVVEEYWMVCGAFPNCVKQPYSLTPLPVQMLVGELDYCPKCEVELHAAMKATRLVDRRTPARIALDKYRPALDRQYKRYFSGTMTDADAALREVRGLIDRIKRSESMPIPGSIISFEELVFYVRAYDLYREQGNTDAASAALAQAFLVASEYPDFDLKTGGLSAVCDRLIHWIDYDYELGEVLCPVWRKRPRERIAEDKDD